MFESQELLGQQCPSWRHITTQKYCSIISTEGDVKGERSSLRSSEDSYRVFESRGHSVLSGVRSQIYLVDTNKPRKDSPEARRQRASDLAHEQETTTNATSALTVPQIAPINYRTLTPLRSKNPTEDLAAITEGISEVEQRTGTNSGVRKQNNRTRQCR